MSDWQKVERITPEMVGWEAKAAEQCPIIGITGVGKSRFLGIEYGVEKEFAIDRWLVRPPQPAKKKLSERIEEGCVGYPFETMNPKEEIRNNAHYANRRIDLLIKYFDEEFEKREGK